MILVLCKTWRRSIGMAMWMNALVNETTKKHFCFMLLPLSSTGDGMDLTRIFFSLFLFIRFVCVCVYFNCVPSMLMQIQANARLPFYRNNLLKKKKKKHNKAANKTKKKHLNAKLKSYSFTCNNSNKTQSDIELTTPQPKCHLLAPVIVTIIIFM